MPDLVIPDEPLDLSDLQGVYDSFISGDRPKVILNSLRIVREGPLEAYRVTKSTKQTEYVQYYVFLLNDHACFGRAPTAKEQKKAKHSSQKYVLDLFVTFRPDMKILRDGEEERTFQLEAETTKIFLRAADEDAASDWADDIEACIDHQFDAPAEPPKVFKEENGEKVWDPRGGLEEKQLQALETFKARISKLELDDDGKKYMDDAACLRFLRARQFDLDKAFVMAENFLKWRAQEKPWTVTAQDVKGEIEKGALYCHPTARDKMGRPVVYMRSRLGGEDADLKVPSFIWVLEKAISKMDTKHTGVEKMDWIIDIGGTKFEASKMSETVKVSKGIINMLQDNYPERLGIVVLVNPPSLFLTLFKLIKGFIDPITRRKIVFIKSEKDYPKLRGLFEPENLEKEFGGTNEYQFEFDKLEE